LIEKASELSEEMVEKELDELGSRLADTLLGSALLDGALLGVLDSGKTRVKRARFRVVCLC
jgi:hypothetical protein